MAENADLEGGGPDLEQAYARVRVGRGRVPNVFRAMAASPPLIEIVSAVGAFFRADSVVPALLREAATLGVAAATGCEYEWSQHFPVAQRLGLEPNDLIIGLADDTTAPAAAARVGTAVALGKPPAEGDRRALIGAVGERGFLELTALAAYYGMLAALIRAWNVALDDGVQPRIPPPRFDD